MGRREVSFAPWMGIPDCSTCSLRGKACGMSTSGDATVSATGEGEGPVVSVMGAVGAGGEEEAT